MATRPTPRSRTHASAGASATTRRAARAASRGSNSMPLVLGGVGLVVVVVVLVMMNSGGGGGGAQQPAAPPQAPGAAPASQPKAAPVQLAAAKAGKAPARPAPPLTQAMLDQVRSLTASASALYNDGVKARSAGDNAAARERQAAAKDTLDQLQTLLQAPLLWQEEAQMEGWAQPAEYITLEREYGAAMTLTKKIRMGGGK